jgi:hypothetical protein
VCYATGAPRGITQTTATSCWCALKSRGYEHLARAQDGDQPFSQRTASPNHALTRTVCLSFLRETLYDPARVVDVPGAIPATGCASTAEGILEGAAF